MAVNIPFQIKTDIARTRPAARKVRGKGRRAKLAPFAAAWPGADAPAAPGGARPGSVEPQENAARLVALGGQEKPSRGGEVHGLAGSRYGAERGDVRGGQRLFRCPQRVKLARRPHHQKPVQIHAELRQPFGVRQPVLKEIRLGRGPEQHAIARRHHRPAERKAQGRRMIAGQAGRISLSGPCATAWRIASKEGLPESVFSGKSFRTKLNAAGPSDLDMGEN